MTILILYESVTGNAKGMARILQLFFERAGATVTVGQMQQTDAAEMANYDAVIIATYTWLGGIVPPPVNDFYEDIPQVDLSRPVVVGVAGTGDSWYGKDYNTAPDLFDAAFEKAGAVIGAAPVKIEQGAEKSDMPAFATFVDAIIAKVKEVQTKPKE